MITNLRLTGHILTGRRSTLRIAGEDIGGRVWANPCDATGRVTDARHVEAKPDDWAQLERLLRVRGAL